jgi:NADH-quinone oxidoreductase subunit E
MRTTRQRSSRRVDLGSRSRIIPTLQRIQAERRYLPRDVIRRVSRELRVSEHEIYGVATFYAQFRFHPPGRHHLKVCLGTACHVGGGESFLDAVRRKTGIGPGETSPDRKLSLERVACLGCCALAPVVVVGEQVHGRLSRVEFQELLGKLD